MKQLSEHLNAPIDNYVREVIIPSLGGSADDYDVEAIARELICWYEQTDDQGNPLINYLDLAECDVDNG